MGAIDINAGELAGAAMAGVGGQVMGNAMGMFMGENSMASQEAMAKRMAIFNREQAMQMWRDTNYKAQADQMRKAGLNVGLMYGKGGGGGATTGFNTGQMPSGYQGNNSNPMEVASNLASLELMKAQARKTNAEADVTESTGKPKAEAEIGLLNANTGNVQADTELKRVNTEISKINQEISEGSKQYSIYGIMANAEKAIAEASSAMTKANVDANTKDTQINL